MLTSYGKLAIAVIVYYVLALPIAVWICIRHGFGRHAGWFYLMTLSIVRIVGAALRLAADAHPSEGLYIGTFVLSSIGLAPLLLALMGMIKRVNDGKEFGSVRVPPRAFQVTHIVTLVGLIMAIVAGTDSSSSKPSTLADAKTDRKVSSVLLLVSLIFSSCMVVFLASRARKIILGDRVIVHCVLLALPFLFVRVAYSMLLSFDKNINPLLPNIYIEAFMQILMEMIVYSLFLTAGVSAPKTNPVDHPYGQGIELARNKYEPNYANGREERGVVSEPRR